MKITKPDLHKKAKSIIENLYGADAEFREGQYEAVEVEA